MTTAHDEPRVGAGACLKASMLLRRRIHHYRGIGVDDQQALLAVCQLLDALSHGLATSTTATPGGVERAALRLADQLHRADVRVVPVPRDGDAS